MNPCSSNARTRRKQGGAEMPTRRANSTFVMRPSACNSDKIKRSIGSSLVKGIKLRPLFLALLYHNRTSAQYYFTSAQHSFAPQQTHCFNKNPLFSCGPQMSICHPTQI